MSAAVPIIDWLEPVKADDGLPLPLRRTRPDGRERRPALLLHGASASGDTFLVPSGRSLVDLLWQQDFDVFILDWRASRIVTDQGHSPAIWKATTCDDVIKLDLPQALDSIGGLLGGAAERPVHLGVLAHCMGAGCLAMAIAKGTLKSRRARLTRVVFSTLGLFYGVSWDGWAKLHDRTLERLAGEQPNVARIDPGYTPWPSPLEDAYQLWPRTLGPSCGVEFCRRLAFMYGLPFLHSNLADAIDHNEIRRQFGGIPLRLYMHAAQNAYRGFAAVFDAEAMLPNGVPDDEVPAMLAKDYIDGEPFLDLEKVTILGGAQNPLWHRDSADRMYDWLRRVLPAGRCVKHVLDGYGHQDLWWGRRSWDDVFPLVREALGPVIRMLIVVSQTKPERYDRLERVFGRTHDVIIDRRVRERRQRQQRVPVERRRGDRRQRDIANDLRTIGSALVRR